MKNTFPASTALLWASVAAGLICAPVADLGQGSSAAAPTTATPGKFVDVTASKGVNFTAVASHTSHKYLLETMGSGVAAFDYDDDGHLDLFFVNGAPLDDPTEKVRFPEAIAKRLEPAVPPA